MANNTPRRNNNDIEDLENAFKKLANKRQPHKYAKSRDDKVITVLIICISAFLILAIIGGILLFNLSSKGSIISGDVTVLSVNLNGMSTSDASAAIQNAFTQNYGDAAITVDIEDVSVELTASVLSAGLDTDTIIADILSGSFKEANLIDYLLVDSTAILNKVTATIPPIDTPLIPHSYTIEGKAPTAFDKIDEAASQQINITKGTPGKTLGEDSLMQAVKEALWAKKSRISHTCPLSNPEPLDFEAIIKESCTSPVDADYNTETYVISGGTFGYLFDIEEATEAMEAAAAGESFKLLFKWVEPEHTLEELNDSLFKDVLSTYTTKAGWNADRNVNLRLACEAIDGIIMNPGDSFSYNQTLGQRTPEKGYRPGASYVGGETVLDYGGGICQVSSTLYYCTVVADLEILERDCHGYASSYIPLSMDATVFWGGIDYRFRNNSIYPIRIDAHAEGGNVTVSIMGTDYKDYYVKFEYEHLDTYPYEVIYKEMPADNEKGYKDGDIITDEYTGYKSKGYRAKYDKETGELIERILESTDIYSNRDRVICKIVEDATEPTEPIPTDPSETTEPVTPPEPSETEGTTNPPEPTETEGTTNPPEPAETTPSEPPSSETVE